MNNGQRFNSRHKQFPVFSAFLRRSLVSILVASNEGYLIGAVMKDASEEEIVLNSADSSLYTEQGFNMDLDFNLFNDYYLGNMGMELSYPERSYFTTDQQSGRTTAGYSMNPFRKTQDRIYVIGQTETGFGVISYPEAYTEFEIAG